MERMVLERGAATVKLHAGPRVLTAVWRRRTAYQRAISWAGLAPAREVRPGLPRLELPDGVDPDGRICGIRMHMGPWTLVITHKPMPYRRASGDDHSALKCP